MMDKFLSCDWGTTSFRLRLIEAESLEIIDEEKSKQGIAETFQLWKQIGKNEDGRMQFYLDIILQKIKAIEVRSGYTLDNLPIIISGMASSTIGMVDLSYKNIPFLTSGEDLEIFTAEPSENVKHKIVIISGVRAADDIIRGEETKLVGCTVSGESTNHLYIFPGTHPKHIEVKHGLATAFKTYMTGEFFDLLSTKSILANSLVKSENFQAQDNLESFTKGVKESIHSNLLHSCFLVRTNDVFKKLSLEENYFYLSGLLIGSELKDVIAENENKHITIAANAALSAQYIAALQTFGLPNDNTAVAAMDADKALIKGQWKVYKKATGI